jgi:hypothetical protein
VVSALVVELDGDPDEPFAGTELDERRDGHIASSDALAVLDALGPVVAGGHEQRAA